MIGGQFVVNVVSPDRGPLRAVLFDMDGTLLDSERVDILAMSRLFRGDLGLEMDEEDVSSYRNRPSREVLEEIAPDQVEEALAAWLDYHLELVGQACLFPGILEVLRAFSQANLALGVVTGQNRRELDATRRHLTIDELIEVWVSVDDAPFSKPHPAPVHVALDALGCPPGQAVFIGDSQVDMESGRRAGTRLGAALWGLKDPAPLLACQPDYAFGHPEQMESLLSSRQKKGDAP